MSAEGAAAQLLRGLQDLAQTPANDALYDVVRLRLLDGLGCLLAGGALMRAQRGRGQTLLRLSAGEGPVPVVGFGRRADPKTAALINGMSCHIAELDDGHRYGITHAGAVVLPALISTLHHPDLTEQSFLRALLLGYEAAIRMGCSLQPMAKDQGWHGTGMFGCIGAAIGVATALGASPAQMNAALSAGASGASGLLAVIRGASDLKPYNCGQAAQAGLSAGLVAMAGFAGAADVLGGAQGLLDILSGPAAPDLDQLTVAAPYCVETVYLKPYASCRYAHAPIEAALSLRNAHGIAPDQIARVHVSTYRLAVYQHDHTEIHGPGSARMSVPYCVAAALISGETGMAAFGDAMLRDAATLDLTRRVQVVEDPALTALIPARRPAVVTLHLTSGQSLSARVDLPKGEPETAMSPAELRTKFTDLAQFAGYQPEAAGQMADQLLDPDAPKLPLIRALS
ncbi:MAG: hypothetical protein CSA68_08605 [Rhodobacterales bacterium]|nr:MAG: hypothetical protein CSA68_08605 [Rhodobacterales bacterium]